MATLSSRSNKVRQNPSAVTRDNALFQEALSISGHHNQATASNDSPTDSIEILDYIHQNNDLFQPIGIKPGSKGAGLTRLYYENLNGIQARITDNTKRERIMEIIDEMEVDLLAFNEHKINFLHAENRRHGLGTIFNGGETLTRAIGGNIKHPVAKRFGRRMEGGTGLVAYGELASLLRPDLSGMDSRGLARWSYMTFAGSEGELTSVLVGYNPCRTPPTHLSSSYQLQRALLNLTTNDSTCPRRRFESDLLALLKEWRAEGRRIILCLDANDHVYRSRLGAALVNSPELDLQETILSTTGQHLTATHFRGSRPIDAVWATPDLDIANACAMPIGFGVGDHRSFIVDFRTSSMVGTQPQPVKRPAARRLNTKIPRCAETYNFLLETQLERHRVVEKLSSLHLAGGTKEQIKAGLDSIDVVTTQCMKYAEKRCRKLRSGRIPFSPEASMWIKRTLCYRSLLRYWAGKIKNKSNLNRQAKRCQISRPFAMSVQEIKDRLTECKAKCSYFTKHGQRHRQSHLKQRLQLATRRGDERAERQILQIIKSERERSLWRRLNWALGQKKGSSVSSVQVEEDDGNISEYSSQQDIQSIIWSKIHQERYHLAEEAPICQGRLRGEFGYNATTPAGNAVLQGTFNPPYLIHEGTLQLFKAIADIRRIIPPNSVQPIISCQEWQDAWRRKKETTSSSQSGLHFGHYVSGAESVIISQMHSIKTSIALSHGVALNRWQSGLCVMLEKTAGVKLISKLRAILLMEADFNAANKIIFGQRMLHNARRYNLIPDEIFSERQRMADDGILAKTLFYDISRQLRTPAALASVDAANCYDRVAHAVASMVFQAFGATEHSTISMLTAIQQMKFFLRTAFGDSNNAVGSRIHLKTQGFMQGNGASPAGWTVVSITILKAHQEQGHGATFHSPVSGVAKNISCILYVDDNDIIHLCEGELSTASHAHQAIQESVTTWSNLLIATGGALKPSKCSYYIISYDWDQKGTWRYEPNHTQGNLSVSVTLPDGSRAPIQHLSYDTPSVTLGGATCPSGETQGSMSLISEKAQTWAHNARNSRLKPRDFHVSVQKKFWPRIRYGLCANTSSFQDLTKAMHKPYYWMAPIGGFLRSAKREFRYLDTGFYGLGFPHWGIEALIEAYGKFFCHFGTNTVVGVQLQMSVELLAIELGMSDQPFTLDFSRYGQRATHGFCTSLWSKLSKFNLKLEIRNISLRPPREHDSWLMRSFEELGFDTQECNDLNMVRIHQQALYVSDVFQADGITINPRYKHPREAGDQWSTFRFGRQRITPAAFQLWCQALEQLAPGGRKIRKLGKFTAMTHVIWPWRLNMQRTELYRITARGFNVYERDQRERRSRHSKFSLSRHCSEIPQNSLYCSTLSEVHNIATMHSHCLPPPLKSNPTHFHQALISWGHLGIWDDLKFTGDGTWVYSAIQQNSLICVSDGSYISQLHPDVCSTAVMIECTLGGGSLSVSFAEESLAANAYRGELLGLMTVHLLLQSINLSRPELSGTVKIYSDCIGALRTIQNLPASRIPPTWSHSDILKVIATNCSHLSFQRSFHHVRAHQDDTENWETLDRASQLNCACDAAAKRRIYEYENTVPANRRFPLEPVTLYAGNHKLTSNTSQHLRYHAHQQEALRLFRELGILTEAQIEEIAWRQVYDTLHTMPKMFQLFIAKQMLNVSAVLGNLSKQKDYQHLGEKCPSCMLEQESAAHILYCQEAGRIKNSYLQLGYVTNWLYEAGTNPGLSHVLSNFLLTKGTMIHRGQPIQSPSEYYTLIESLTLIGWRRLMEGMVSKAFLFLPAEDLMTEQCKFTTEQWMQTFATRLIEATHGHWIYRNIVMHDYISGHVTTRTKEQILEEIKRQQDLGGEGITLQDQWMTELHLPDMEHTTGEKVTYWLLAIQAARRRHDMDRTQQ